MRGVVVTRFGGPDVLEVQDLPSPRPGPGQVAVRVKYASINFADVMAREGRYHGGGAAPFVPGLDLIGEVVSVGENVESSLVGEEVFGFPINGSYQEIALCDRRLVTAAPRGVDSATVGASPLVLSTSIELMSRGVNNDTSSALVYAGAGGVGLTLCQLLSSSGIPRVVALVGNEFKADVSLSFGATDAVIYRDNPEFALEVLKIVGPGGVDTVFNSVAGDTGIQDLAMLANFGRLLIYGMASGSPSNYPSNALHGSSRSVIGFSFGTLRRVQPDKVPAILSKCHDILEEGDIKFKIAGVIKPEMIGQAQDDLQNSRTSGKLLIDFT